MNPELTDLLQRQGGVVTHGQALTHLSGRRLRYAVEDGELHKIWHGIYGDRPPDTELRLCGLDLLTGCRVATCLGTAAATHGFDTEERDVLHVLNPVGRQLRPVPGLVVHRRDGAPLVMVEGRPTTAPAWTAMEVARDLWRPRAFATLGAALRSGTCDAQEMQAAAEGQAGRPGIVKVRALLPVVDPRVESPMESETHLVMVDGGLAPPELQYEIVDRNFQTWRVDFAWPEFKVAVEYDGLDWHSGVDALVRDRRRRAALQEVGWVVVAVIYDDVRRRPLEMLRRIEVQLERAAA
ncbi:DUF559 domain-containing protein [Mycobacterium sp. M1]|uniref:DUF559 domain-containing protein n=1 Tax=Mycolicibacter acidiphilus TaxID=2835306 RepID=A0ABS5RLX5_9MYCO|nr:type IV toxin-antitoxin system AbiEi family antitoxin domain-containing protein [Mycolicibacter acidiphilus]MBS9535184.1 DUF559 domain-containing protein [Mycolicibacter acidiphilus]